MKYQQVADIVVELNSCATCVKGAGRAWTALNPSKLKKYVFRNFGLLKSFNFTTSKKLKSHIFELQVSKEAEFCDL